MLQKMMEINLENSWECQFGTGFRFSLPFLCPLLSWNHDIKTPTPANPIRSDTHAHSATHSYITPILCPRVPQYI
jgi:hypothetical protein